MDLKLLRCFVAVAEELHFGRAAARLNLAQQPLSAQIRRLEAELGVTLFRRTTRRVELTDAGRAFLADVRPALDLVRRGADAARRAERGEVGRLVVGYVSTTLYGVMPNVVRAFRERRPGVEVVLRELCSPELEEHLLAGDVDAAFLSPQGQYPGLVFHPVAREAVLVALPAGHPLAARARVPLSALADEPLVNYDRDTKPAIHDGVVAACLAAGFSPRVVQEAGSEAAVIGLVAAGLGAAVVSASLRGLRAGEVEYRELVPATAIEYALAWRRGDDAPLVRALREITDDVVGAAPALREVVA